MRPFGSTWTAIAALTASSTLAANGQIEAIGDVQITGQTVTSDNSVLTRGLGDARYLQADQSSSSGGANMIPRIGTDGTFRTTAINSNTAFTPPPIQIAARQRLNFEIPSGGNGANILLFHDHGHSGGVGGSSHELLFSAGRFCFYWDDGFQLGNAEAGRATRFIYLRSIGNASAADPVRESVPIWFDGHFYNNGVPIESKIGIQWVPAGDHAGELVFGISGSTYSNSNSGRITGMGGLVKPMSITQDGIKMGTGKSITFGDGTSLSTATPIGRAGDVTLVGGTASVSDPSCDSFTRVFHSRRSSGGTIGELTYTVNNGVGFTIKSSSSSDTSRVSYYLVQGATAENAPSISGSNSVTDILIAGSGGGTSTWQWCANGIAIPGETESSYTIQASDIGKVVTCLEDGIASNAVSVWHPNKEAGYFADFSADSGVVKTGGASANHGETVAMWQDQSGKSNHLTQANGTAQPLLDATTHAGYPFLKFDNINDSLGKIVTVPTPHTVYIVAEAKTVNANKRLFSMGSSGPRMSIEAVTNSVKNVDATAGPGQMSVNTKHIITARTAASLNAIRVDALSEAKTATGTASSGTELIVSQSAPGGGADCSVYGLLVFTADHDAATQARVRKWLKAKWGTP